MVDIISADSTEVLDPDSVGGLRQDLVLIPASAWILGFVSGLMTSSRLSGRQYLAENAHRLPTTVQGVMYGGVIGGLKTGTRLGLWTAAFVGIEEGIEIGLRRTIPHHEKYRTRWISGGIAGLGLAGAAGQIYRLSRFGGVRRIILGSGLGMLAGGSHDLRDWLRLHKLGIEE